MIIPWERKENNRLIIEEKKNKPWNIHRASSLSISVDFSTFKMMTSVYRWASWEAWVVVTDNRRRRTWRTDSRSISVVDIFRGWLPSMESDWRRRSNHRLFYSSLASIHPTNEPNLETESRRSSAEFFRAFAAWSDMIWISFTFFVVLFSLFFITIYSQSQIIKAKQKKKFVLFLFLSD